MDKTKRSPNRRGEMSQTEKPTEVKEPFLKAGFFERLLGNTYKKRIKEPFIIMITKDHKARIIQGVKGGNITLGAEPNIKRIELTPDKLIDLSYGGDSYRGWIAYEEEMTAYPTHVKHDSEMFYKIIQKLSLNYQDFLTKQGSIKARTYLMISMGAVLILYFLYQSGIVDRILSGG